MRTPPRCERVPVCFAIHAVVVLTGIALGLALAQLWFSPFSSWFFIRALATLVVIAAYTCLFSVMMSDARETRRLGSQEELE